VASIALFAELDDAHFAFDQIGRDDKETLGVGNGAEVGRAFEGGRLFLHGCRCL
jgi:hypothetical protein